MAADSALEGAEKERETDMRRLVSRRHLLVGFGAAALLSACGGEDHQASNDGLRHISDAQRAGAQPLCASPLLPRLRSRPVGHFCFKTRQLSFTLTSLLTPGSSMVTP